MTSEFTGSQVPEPEFADDDGHADPELRKVLAAYVASGLAVDSRALLARLVHARLLVPVVSVADSSEAGVEKDSHMSAVELHGADGHKALLAFTGTDSVQLWNPEARPLPRHAYLVARAALEQELDAIVLDINGPNVCAIDGQLLNLLAIGPERGALLDQELTDVCERLASLVAVVRGTWQATDDSIVITVYLSGPDPALPGQISQVLATSQLHALLDIPLEVALSGQTSK